MKAPANRVLFLLGLGVALSFWSLSPGSLTPAGETSNEITAARSVLNALPGNLFPDWQVVGAPPRTGFLELIVHLPFLIAVRIFSALPGTQELFLAIEPVLLSTLIVLLVFLWSERLTGDRLRAIGYALVAAFCTLIWPYAYFGMEVQQSLFLLLAAFMALAGTSRRGWGWWVLFGLCCGMILSVKPSSIVMAPAVAFLIFRSHASDMEPGRIARMWAAISITLMMFLANTWWRNRDEGLVNAWSGFLGEHSVADPLAWAFNVVALIGSPGKGLIVYVPVAIVAAICFRRAWERQRDLAIFTMLALVSLTAALATVDYWSDETWGPRHLHALAAPLVLLVAASSRPGERARARAPLFAAAFLGFCVSFFGATYDYRVHQRVAELSGQSTLQTLQMNAAWNHVKFNARLLRVWLTTSPGDEVYWKAEPVWYYDIPDWASHIEAVRIDPWSKPHALLIAEWGKKVPSAGWLSVFVSLIAGPVLILLSIAAARGGGDTTRRGLHFASLVWSVCVSVIYLGVCVSTLYSPFGPGYEKVWAIPLAIVSLLVFSAHFFARPFVLKVLFPCLIGIVSIVILIRSGSVGPFLVAVLLFVAALGFGDGVMRLLWLVRDDSRQMETTLCSLMAGVGLLGLAGFILAILHLLDVLVVAALLAAGALLSVRRLRRLRWRPFSRTDGAEVREAPALVAMGGYIVALNLAWAVAPEIQFDALNYHLHVPASWASAGGAVDLLYTHSYLAGFMETLYALAMVLSNQTAAELVPFAMGLVTAGCVFVLADRLGGPRAAIWAALLFYSVPLIVWSSGTTDVELTLGAFIGVLLLSMMRWRESGRTGWLYLAAILIGAGVATKPTMALAVPVFAGLLLLFIVRADTFLPQLRTVLFVVLVALAVSVPWYLLRAHYTGNPFYPVLNEWFPVHRYVHEDLPPLGGGVRIPLAASTLIRFPFVFTFDTVEFSESGVTSGGVGPYLLLAIPALALFRRGPFDGKILSMTALTYVAIWTVSFSYARFFVPIIPVLVALGVASVMVVTRGRIWLAQSMLILIFAGQALSMPVQFWMASDRIPISNAMGVESDEEFLARVHRGYPAVSYLNQNGRPGDAAIGVGIERVRYYLRMPFHSWRDVPEVRQISHISDEKELALQLESRGYDWLIIDQAEPHRNETYLSPEFLECFAELHFSERQHSVYRLRGSGESCR
ncbi:MAG TPA: glycosyltransferase family 39 protein [Thermoanaerobaculia bacterium]|nr:glycosyltransferase family 39 protein [Thermoanaerobaculia bacterium]